LDSDEEDEIDEIKEGGLDDEDLGAQEETTIVKKLRERERRGEEREIRGDYCIWMIIF
jgi:hypothetical protein